MAASPGPDVAAHYGRPGILESIDAALAAAGLSAGSLRPDDLAPVDQFHTRGREATLDVARLAGITGTDELLDLGGGIGGPARMVAAAFGCRVTVLDLTPGFRRVGQELTRRMGLSDRVSFRVGDVTAASLAWAEERAARGSSEPLGPHVLLGEGARAPFANLRRGLAEDRVRVIEAVLE